VEPLRPLDAVLDACAILAFLEDEPGSDVVRQALADRACAMHAINLCEVLCQVRRASDKSRVNEVLVWIRDKVGVDIREDFDEAIWVRASEIKADLARVSLADCLCAALAERLGAPVLTTDRREFEPLQEAGVCKVEFAR